MKSNTHHNTNEAPDSFANLLRDAVNNEPLPAADPSLREAVLQRLDQPQVEPALSVSMADRRRTFYQRAGIALVSTAALALAAVIWQQQHTMELSLRDSEVRNAGAREELIDRLGVPASNAPANNPSAHLPRAKLNHGLGMGDRPEEEVEKYSYSTRLPRGDSGKYERDELIVAATESTAAPVATQPASQPSVASASGTSGDGKVREYDAMIAGRRSGGLPADPASFSEQGQKNLSPAGMMSHRESSGAAGGPVPGLPGPGLAGPGMPAGLGGGPGGVPAPANRPGVAPPQPGEPASRTAVRAEQASAPATAPAGLTTGKDPQKPSDSRLREESRPALELAELSKAEVQLQREARMITDEKLLRERLVELKQAQVKGREVLQSELESLEKRVKEVADRDDQYSRYYAAPGNEQYARIVENQFLNPNIRAYAESTFAIDVDTASYANVRRFLTSGQLPPPDAVRLEELVNYFKYQYPQPKGDEPFSVNTEMADCPWNPGHKLLRVGLQGKDIHRAERPASNLVFLIDTSGSMTDQNKLPLLKQAFTMLTTELGENDKVTIVTYAGNAGLRLPPTRGHEKETIIAAIDGMQSGGSTHGSAGIKLAYEIAAAQFIKGGTNKVILATDGDLNVGITDDAALVELITKQAETGVYLTVLGVGTGNLKDAKMERLADNGNGIYAYLDSIREARKVLVEEMSGSLVTIAKDVKIQLEFNPAHVASYRLLGYENRVMANQDFRNDQKDAGEIGAGHSVTAMYEVVMVSADKKLPDVKTEAKPTDELEYQRFEPGKTVLTEAGKSENILTVRLRYKTPEAKKEDKAAAELKFPLKDKGGSFNSASKEFQFASAVVAFGLSLRNSEYRGSANLSAVAEMAQPALGEDNGGHRAEFLDLVRRAKSLRGE